MTTPTAAYEPFSDETGLRGILFKCAPSLLKCPSFLISVNKTLKQSYTCIEPKDFTCGSYSRNCDCRNLDPDPDIAGIGVALSFLVVGIVSLLIYLVCLFLSMINTTALNPVDRWFREKITEFMSHRISEKTKELWVKVLTKVLLGLSDQQLITSLAILIVAIVKLADGSLTVYHFSVCVDLAWISNGVHATTIRILGSYCRRRVKFPQRVTTLGQVADESSTGEVKKRRLPLMTWLRIVLMSISGILVVFCLVIQGYRPWYDVFQCPVDCARRDLKGNYGGEQGTWSTVSILLFLTTYPVGIMKLSNRGVDITRNVRFQYMKKLASKLKPSGSPNSKKAKSYAVLARIAAYGWWCINSIICDILTTLTWFGTGGWALKADMAWGHEIMKSQNIENTELQWGFGQLVPLIICVLPFINTGETFWDEYLARIGQAEEYDGDQAEECDEDQAEEYDEDPGSSRESEEQVELILYQGVLQSEPGVIYSPDAPVLSNETRTSITLVENS